MPTRPCPLVPRPTWHPCVRILHVLALWHTSIAAEAASRQSGLTRCLPLPPQLPHYQALGSSAAQLANISNSQEVSRERGAWLAGERRLLPPRAPAFCRPTRLPSLWGPPAAPPLPGPLAAEGPAGACTESLWFTSFSRLALILCNTTPPHPHAGQGPAAKEPDGQPSRRA